MEMIREKMAEKLREAERVLIGIGSEWKQGEPEREMMVESAIKALHKMIADKDYFVISTLPKEDLERLHLDPARTVAPLDEDLTEEQWNHYTEWLARTLNRKLVLLELGEGFLHPSLIRWPFEKTAQINYKAHLYRVHKTFYQITDEIKDKATAVKGDSVEFLADWN
ncbi:MAG: hypothetical protein IJO55_08040 [Lachnospiraceae bacterium]|nr:hypothetical protein [Lachnospiraceae bacterium]